MGSTAHATEFTSQVRDHPHIHGEHWLNLVISTAPLGSPPYTWGARNFFYSVKYCHRITPIYMGSTHGERRPVYRSKDHPHIHGEHFCSWSGRFRCVGSPPYTWGALLNRLYALFMDRITPIYMGSTGSGAICRSMAWDHPHIHGEHKNAGCKGVVIKGSPPYTWGAHVPSV